MFFGKDKKRYHALSDYNQNKFGRRMEKAVIDAGFSCPNKDGTAGFGGCAFCASGSAYFTKPALPVLAQLEAEISRIRKKVPDAAICAYLQANTNTYASVDTLRALYTELIRYPSVSALSIATRADCLQTEVVALLEEIAQQAHLTVELGLQTAHDETATRINRGYTWAQFYAGFMALKQKQIRTCAHIINGLPGEDAEMMLSTAKRLGQLRPDAVKIQMLHVMDGTLLADWYLENQFSLLNREAYIALTARQLTYFPPETVVERLTGDGDKRQLLAPEWTRDKRYLLGKIHQYMKQNDWVQGMHFVAGAP